MESHLIFGQHCHSEILKDADLCVREHGIVYVAPTCRNLMGEVVQTLPEQASTVPSLLELYSVKQTNFQGH